MIPVKVGRNIKCIEGYYKTLEKINEHE